MTRVLIVDDRPENLYILRALLTGHGYEVMEARHGAEALTLARQSPPQLIISDLLMPVMDGYTLLRHWKADDRLKVIPFVVYTATYTEPQDEKLALDLGADAFILKPAEPDIFVARIEAVLTQAERGDLSPHPPMGEEKIQLKEYSEVLVRKLEEKTTQLERSNRALQADIAARKQAEDQLRERERRFSALINNLPGAVFRVRNDPNYTTEYVSDQIAELTGYPADDFRENRRNFGKLMHPEDREWVWNETQKALGEHRPYELTYRFIDAHGRVRWNLERGSGIYDANGKLQALEGFVQDVSDRKQAETALRESEARLQLFFECAPAALAMFDREMRYLAVSRRWLEENIPRGQNFLGRSHYDIFPDLPERWKTVHRRCLAGEVVRADVDRYERADGSVHWLSWEVRPWHTGDGAIGGIVMMSEDITKRKEAEAAVRTRTEELQALASRLQAVREEERTAIAREIHDVLAQELTRLKIDIAWINKRIEAPLDEAIRSRVIDKLKDVSAQTDTAIRTVQKIATELRPVVLDSLGLAAAIEWQVEDFEKRTDIRCRVTVPEHDPPLNRDQATACFRILQESLTNVLRHAQATQVDAMLSEADGHLVLTISDNGRGITLEQQLDPHSIGLIGMRERAMSFGGTIAITGSPGEGATVTLRIPLQASAT